VAALRLAGIDVGDVNLDERHGDGGERITKRKARVTVCACIYNGTIGTTTQPVNDLDELPLSISLRELERRSDLSGDNAQSPFDIVQGVGAVYRGLANAEEIEIWSVEDGDPHVFFNPSSHALNC
jgi:hypothetical protein